MIAAMSVTFALVIMGCAVYVLYKLVGFVVEIQREARTGRP